MTESFKEKVQQFIKDIETNGHIDVWFGPPCFMYLSEVTYEKKPCDIMVPASRKYKNGIPGNWVFDVEAIQASKDGKLFVKEGAFYYNLVPDITIDKSTSSILFDTETVVFRGAATAISTKPMDPFFEEGWSYRPISCFGLETNELGNVHD